VFEKKRLDRLLDLHGKSYRIFTWVNEGLRNGRSLTGVSETLSLADAAGQWMRKNGPSFPPELRPAPDELDELAHLFVSYLATSFEVVTGLLVRGCRGCFCCSYWQPARHLRARRPNRKAQAEAEELQALYVRGLAAEMGLVLSDAERHAFVRDARGIRRELALATYVHELERRTAFASQGAGVLVLWRAVAWENGNPRRGFSLTVKQALAAEGAVRGRVSELAGGRAESRRE
jgi:hypothetical protein